MLYIRISIKEYISFTWTASVVYWLVCLPRVHLIDSRSGQIKAYNIGICCLVGHMVLSATFNNISVISWRSVLLVEEAEYPEKTTDLSQVTDTVCHIMLHQVHLAWSGFELTTLVVIEGIYKANYRTITITTAPAVFGSTAYSLRW